MPLMPHVYSVIPSQNGFSRALSDHTASNSSAGPSVYSPWRLPSPVSKSKHLSSETPTEVICAIHFGQRHMSERKMQNIWSAKAKIKFLVTTFEG